MSVKDCTLSELMRDSMQSLIVFWYFYRVEPKECTFRKIQKGNTYPVVAYKKFFISNFLGTNTFLEVSEIVFANLLSGTTPGM